MKDFKHDSTATLSRFGKDKRTRTVKVERVERRPHMAGETEGREQSAEQPRRRSFNPNFDRENRPIHDNNHGEHRSRRFDDSRPTQHNDRRHAFGSDSRRNEDSDFTNDNSRRETTRKPYARKSENGTRSFGKASFGRNGNAKGFNAGKRENSFGHRNNDKRQSETQYPRYNPNKQTGEMRLNRFIAQSGLCSRREADDFIQAGLVTVNGTIVTELGTKVMPTDEVRFNDSIVQGEKKVYLVLNKPKGYVTTLDDPHATKTVMDLVKDACTERIHPVGRLDKNSLGLLLFQYC